MDDDHAVIRLTSKRLDELLMCALDLAQQHHRPVLAYLIKMALLEAKGASEETAIPIMTRNPS